MFGYLYERLSAIFMLQNQVKLSIELFKITVDKQRFGVMFMQLNPSEM